ncbi:hypothetical protein BH10BAC6_BH10BAC6_05160 [soil metagenome]
MRNTTVLAAFLLLSGTASLLAQTNIEGIGTISGSLQTDMQTYKRDSIIGAPNVPERLLSNSFFNLLFQRGKFTAGIRFESYQGPLLGIDPRYQTSGDGTGLGIPYRFATYDDTNFEVTAGNFYEQFGSGMILRTYEERNLGFDNSIDGLRLRFKPVDGVKITGLIGRQRSFWQKSEGIVRGGDLSVDIGALADSLLPKSMVVLLGSSVMSRYQADQNDFLKLPENVLAWSSRLTFGYKDFNMVAEYAYKINDPSAANVFNYNTGDALYVNASYAIAGFGMNVAAKRIDNMDFRSDRTATGNVQTINYLPALTRQHTWRLITLYPYATQQTGEFGAQADVTWTIPKGVLGDDETVVSGNFSTIYALDTMHVDQFTYTAKFMPSNRQYYRDANIEIQRKWGKDFKTTLAYIDVFYDQDIIERRAAPTETKFGVTHAQLLVLELQAKVAKGKQLRMELQHMWSKPADNATQVALLNGNWAMVLIEYSVSPLWYFTVFNEYNYGNQDENLKLNYPNASVAYSHDALRVQLGYGRVRGGILCVGGICRPVPASNGFSLGVTYTF